LFHKSVLSYDCFTKQNLKQLSQIIVIYLGQHNSSRK
jgi:hypothetical protein